jgi:predicted CXXCH cytochrome family protein
VRWLAVLLLVACRGPVTPPQAADGRVVASNVLRGDYAGSETCADCHAQIYAAWKASPMRNMTRAAGTAQIRAPFDGATLRVGPDSCTMESDGANRFMRVTTADGSERFRVTKVVGGHYREDFVGVSERGGPEHVLPATYVFATRSWRYKGYSVMVKERPRMSVRGVWAQECIGCHNTLPLATLLYDELYGPGLPGYQGKVSDRVIPKQRAWTARPRDADGLARALVAEIRFLGGEPPENTSLRALLPAAAVASEQRLDGEHLVELGIGCEACHNGSREHVANERVLPAFAARTQLFGVSPPKGQDGTRAQWINHTCAKCHTVLFTRYAWTWEGGERTRDAGGSTINSGEGRDFQLGGCSTQLACTDCHDPHAADPSEQLARLATPAGNAVCARCHGAIAAAAAGHSHHKAGGAGTACIACHMPKKNMGLDYGLSRYHRIGSPTDERRVLGDRPIECALCHTDKSVEQLVGAMEQWWRKRYDRAALRRLYGDDLGANAMRATLVRGKPHEQAVAIAVFGEQRVASAIGLLAPQLAHDYPLVRYFALRALQTITGEPIAIDVGAAAPDVRAAAEAWLRARR